MNKLTVKIVHDPDPQNPREWDQLGIIAGFHRRYNIGDSDPGVLLDGGTISANDYDGWDEMEADLRQRGALCIMPLFLYDHGGTSLSISGFAGRAQHADWDSGRVGFTFTTRKRMGEFLGETRLTSKTRERVENALKGEVKEYDQYMTGDVYGYIIEDETGDVVDTSWSIYGFKVVKQEAARELAWFVENKLDLDYSNV
jgi:hypothetical protein